jgi:transketolase
VRKRYEAYGWDVHEVDGHNFDDLHEVMSKVRANQQRPTLIIATTIIGKGAPTMAGTSRVHGSPLGADEVRAAKAALNLPEEPFYVPQAVYDYFNRKVQEDIKIEESWNLTFDAWSKDNPELYKVFQTMQEHKLPGDLEQKLQSIDIKAPVAGRKASNTVIQTISDFLPQLIGGSADLSCSDLTMISKYPIITSSDFSGRNIKFGIREFGMATMATGLAQTRMFTPFIGTFLTFSDYMRNAIRLCCLMKERVIYQFTHDSIFLGEDGPTHQPIEHYAALRAMVNLHVIRPADTNEVKMAWNAALTYDGPTALILSRQNLPDLSGTKVPYAEGVGRGAYIIKKEKNKPKFTLVATGSELSLAMDVADALEKMGHDVRVISMPCWEIFEEQPQDYKAKIFGGNLGQRVSIEAGVELGWHKYIGSDGIAIAIDRFGASAPYKDLTVEYGYTVESILERIL